MKGYKGMNPDMTCRGMKFAVGKTYHVDGEISVCKNGLHFCERLTDVFNYYERDGHRFFEVEASGVIKTEGRKSATSGMTILRELNDIEINRAAYGNSFGNGNGYDDGNGNGNGNSFGNGNGYGNGFGNSFGNGNGYGNGFGNGNGNGFGNGNGNGNGCGNGYCSIQRILLLFA